MCRYELRPRSVLYIDDDGLLHGFAFASVDGGNDEASLWTTVRLTEFGVPAEQLDLVRDQIEA